MTFSLTGKFYQGARNRQAECYKTDRKASYSHGLKTGAGSPILKGVSMQRLLVTSRASWWLVTQHVKFALPAVGLNSLWPGRTRQSLTGLRAKTFLLEPQLTGSV